MEHASLIIGLIVSILTLVGFVSGLFRWIWKKVRARFLSSENALQIPGKTITIVRHPSPTPTWWHLGSSAGEPSMQLVGDLLVTNVTKLDVLVPVVMLKKPRSFGFVTVCSPGSGLHGQFAIPSGRTTDLRFVMFVTPPPAKSGRPFVGDVALIDQFGNEHWIRDVEFTCK